ncbi:hypothetical protein BDK92_7301 [Micromonospora pisi]|uniref:Uncharacterized protein n=1 Tax=Micromonospora pisi TaxID=589240 RepID=A0A495JXA1_9ACTN|nr:hypothetical protein [Micromonospora pisi]RKR92819.1 hypothetical protein BDK92_7301 [Micromonospora pisi]
MDVCEVWAARDFLSWVRSPSGTPVELPEPCGHPNQQCPSAEWTYAVTDAGRTLHLVAGEVRYGVRALCGQIVHRQASPLDHLAGGRVCVRCDSRTTPTGGTNA